MNFLKVITKGKNYYFINGKRTKENNFFLQRLYEETKEHTATISVTEKDNKKRVTWVY